MKPTLKQIFDFGLERVPTNRLFTLKKYGKTYEYTTSKEYKKKYLISVITYTAVVWFGYKPKEISEFRGCHIGTVYDLIKKVKDVESLQLKSEELKDSLNLLYSAPDDESKYDYTVRILRIYASKNNFNTRSPEDLTKLEEWLINRLYEVENK